MNLTLPTDSEERKTIPLYSGVRAYFPAALAGVAKHSKIGNDKHNKGEPLHHARGKSMDHEECIDRHLMDLADLRAAYQRRPPPVTTERDSAYITAILAEANALCWRALALSQKLHEELAGAPLAPGARLPVTESQFDMVEAVRDLAEEGIRTVGITRDGGVEVTNRPAGPFAEAIRVGEESAKLFQKRPLKMTRTCGMMVTNPANDDLHSCKLDHGHKGRCA